LSVHDYLFRFKDTWQNESFYKIRINSIYAFHEKDSDDI
jgi:hypothetical protein